MKKSDMIMDHWGVEQMSSFRLFPDSWKTNTAYTHTTQPIQIALDSLLFTAPITLILQKWQAVSFFDRIHNIN